MKKNILLLICSLSLANVSFAQPSENNIEITKFNTANEQTITPIKIEVASPKMENTLQNSLNKEQVINIFNQKVKTTILTEDEKNIFLKKANDALPSEKLLKNQFFVIADRNPKKQNAALAYWNNDTKQIELIGFSKISTGSVRKRHFYTPVGWFDNSPEHGSYRAQGTKNENGIRGYGRKGMRVWDFGWVPSTSGYTKGLNIDIRFQMHATDPDYLEPRLGTPDSQGCVRIHNTFNDFLDQYGIIDEQYEAINSWVLRKDRKIIQEPGSYLLVIDTEVV